MLLWIPAGLLLTLVSGQMDIRLTDVASEAGVALVNVSGEKSKKYIVESQGNGAAFFDYDEDGDIDLLVVNGSTLTRLEEGGSPMAAMYRNLGDGRFTDVTAPAGLGVLGWGMGVCVADYDNDGAEDVYLTAYGPNRLFHNRGDGTFEDVTLASGVGDARYGTGCSFGDYDRDGYLDLYVANYVDFDLEIAQNAGENPNCQIMGVPVSCGPRHFRGEPDVLFRNGRDGTFRDVTAEAGIDGRNYYGFGVVSGDLDGDGWLDIYVANDSRPNFFFKNDGDGTFTEMGLAVGIALSEEGRQEAGMGVDMGDYDNDGWLDVFVTNFSHETYTLYRGGPTGFFTDATYPAGLGAATLTYLGWGTGFVDLDNDGWRDIFVANGHVHPEVDRSSLDTTYAQRQQLFHNLGQGRFRDVAVEVGGALLHEASSRGAAFGDYDDDGDLDIFVVNLDEAASVLRNDGGNARRWLRLRLIDRVGNRDAVGARVTVEASGTSQLAEVRSGGGYLSENDRRLHFGLGASVRVEKVEIRWPSGERETLRALAVDTTWTIVEGLGVVAP